VEEQSRLGIGTQGGKEAMARWVVRLALKGHINHASELVFLEKKTIYFHMMWNKYICYMKGVAFC
jgi:hypothetical protein